MAAEMTRTLLVILGMRSNHCREKLAAALEAVPGVKETHVSLHRANAQIVHEPGCDPAALVAAVERAGFIAMIDSTQPGQASPKGPVNPPRPAEEQTRKRRRA